MFEGGAIGNTATAGNAPTLESLRKTIEELEARPKPAHWGDDLHVTEDFYGHLRERFKPVGAPPEWSLFWPSVRVIVDLEPGTEPPYSWKPRPEVEKEESDGRP